MDSMESADPGQNSSKRQRQSLDSVSAATRTIVASQDSLGSVRHEKAAGRRKSRVTFSPEIVTRTQKEGSGSSQSPNSFGNVSPIVMSDSPVSVRSVSGSRDLSDKTDYCTSPELPGDVQTPISVNDPEVATTSPDAFPSRTRSNRMQRRKLISSQESAATTTSATQSSMEDRTFPEATKRDGKSGHLNHQQIRKAAKPKPVRIKVGLSQSSSESMASGRIPSRHRSKKTPSTREVSEFDFRDDFVLSDKENAKPKTTAAIKAKPNALGRANKGKQKVVKKKPLAGTHKVCCRKGCWISPKSKVLIQWNTRITMQLIDALLTTIYPILHGISTLPVVLSFYRHRRDCEVWGLGLII